MNKNNLRFRNKGKILSQPLNVCKTPFNIAFTSHKYQDKNTRYHRIVTIPRLRL